MQQSAPMIALVQNDIPLRGLLVEFLTEEGYQVTCYHERERLFASLQQTPPALLLLDLHLGLRYGGWEILYALRQHPASTRLPALLMTDAVFAHIYAALIGQLQVVIQMKPFDLDELLGTVSEALRNSPDVDFSSTPLST